MKIIFAGTPEFARTALAAIVDRREVCVVYTQPDRPAGRGRKVTASPVKQLATQTGLPVRQPETLRDPRVVSELAAWDADIMVVVAYGLILPPAVLAIPRRGCINIHASSLPRWRGAAPIQRAIMAGDTTTGVTIIQMDAGLDTGPMLWHESCPIEADETGGSLHDKLAALGAQAALSAMDRLEAGTATALKQEDSLATYAKKLDKEEAWIDWSQDAVTICRKVRAFNPWPIARFKLDAGRVVHAWFAQPLDQHVMADPGTVVMVSKAGIDIASAHGVVRLTQVQSPGGRPMAVADWLNSQHLDSGTRCG